LDIAEMIFQLHPASGNRSRALFTGPTNLFFFSKTFIKNGSHDTIYTFKNYFTTNVFNFQFSAISGIQTNPKFTMLTSS